MNNRIQILDTGSVYTDKLKQVFHKNPYMHTNSMIKKLIDNAHKHKDNEGMLTNQPITVIRYKDNSGVQLRRRIVSIEYNCETLKVLLDCATLITINIDSDQLDQIVSDSGEVMGLDDNLPDLIAEYPIEDAFILIWDEIVKGAKFTFKIQKF